jgi:hypothetical protein
VTRLAFVKTRQNQRSGIRFARVVWHHRIMKTFLASAAAVAVCVSPAIGASTQSGLTGTVQRACGAAKMCAAGPTRATLIFSRKGESMRTRSGSDGAYRVLLSPGKYRVTTYPRVGISAPRVRPGLVHVRAGHVDELDFTVTLGLSQIP